MLAVDVVIGPIDNSWGISRRVVTFLTLEGAKTEQTVGVASATRVGDSILERVLFIVDGSSSELGAPYPAGNPGEPGEWGSTQPITLRRRKTASSDKGSPALRLDALLRQRLALANDKLVKVVERTFHWHRTSKDVMAPDFPVRPTASGWRAHYRPPEDRPGAVGAAVWHPSGNASKTTVALLPKSIPGGFLDDWRVREDRQKTEDFAGWLKREGYRPDAFDVYLCRWAYSQTFNV